MQKQSTCYFPLLQLQHAGVCSVLLVGGAACWWKKPSNRCRYSYACKVLPTVKLFYFLT